MKGYIYQMETDFSITAATSADAQAIAALHVMSWRSAYRGILPEDYLGGDVEPERRSH